jgi:hypothetical protein
MCDLEMLLERLDEAELVAASWKREAELNEQAANESSGYAKRLAEADALIAKGLAVVHDFLPNIGRCVLQDYQRMNEFCSEAAARAAVSAVQPERCCVDYPRCDCNSPAEWPTREEAEKRAAELMAIGRATLSRSKHTPECSYWDGLMAQVCNCGATGHTSGSAL